MMHGSLSAEALAELRGTVLGPVLVDGDAGYDEARIAWNGMFDRRPGAVVRCMGVADVQAAIDCARTHGIAVAIRGGGHSVSGSSTIDGGMLIDLGLMRGVHVDPVRRTAVAAAGTLWSEVDRETQVHGLATTGGMISHTGIAGLTVGGGVGRFMRKVGLTCDNVLGFDVVTADGSWRHVDAERHPDLFWALRGGGGDIAVVTHFEYRLHPLGPTVYGGALGWPMDQARDVLTGLRAEIDNSPEELQLQFVLCTAPDVEFIPESLRGKPALMLNTTWMGPDMSEGERHMAPFRSTVAPTLDMLGPVPYTTLQAMSDILAPHGRRAYSKTGYLASLSDDVIDVALTHAVTFPGPFALIELYQMGGAVSRVPAGDTAFANRDAGFMCIVGGGWHDEDLDGPFMEWARGVDVAMSPLRQPGRYLNFVYEEDVDTERDAIGAETFSRLAEIKAAYDPDGVLSREASARRAAMAASPS